MALLFFFQIILAHPFEITVFSGIYFIALDNMFSSNSKAVSWYIDFIMAVISRRKNNLTDIM